MGDLSILGKNNSKDWKHLSSSLLQSLPFEGLELGAQKSCQLLYIWWTCLAHFVISHSKKPLSVIVVVLVTISVNKPCYFVDWLWKLLFYICYARRGSTEKKQELAENRCEKRREKNYFCKLVWGTFPQQLWKHRTVTWGKVSDSIEQIFLKQKEVRP